MQPILGIISSYFYFRMQEKKFPPPLFIIIHFSMLSTYIKWAFAPIVIWIDIGMTFWYIHLIKNNKKISIDQLATLAKKFIDKAKDKTKE